ncbi:hypothetical protein JHK85_008334 [Glycine max]|nr:hypothetical protein JHK85_008334 [Glycine max]
MMTTLKLNLGQHMIVSPCKIAFAPPSSVTVSLTHQHSSVHSSSSPSLILRHNGRRVRSHSHSFPESDDQVEDLRVPDHWLDPTMAFKILKQTDLGEILLKMARELEIINYKESFYGAFSSLIS